MIIWKKEWLWEDESVWSFINKLEYLNQINDSELKSIFKYEKNNLLLHDMKKYYLDSFILDYEEVKNILGVDLVKRQKRSINKIISPFTLNSYITGAKCSKNTAEKWFYNHLHFCPECIKLGYHSLRHQFKYNNDMCFIHNCKLVHHCPNCGNQIPYRFLYNRTNTYYSCTCGYILFDPPFEEAYELWEKPISFKDNSFKQLNTSKMFVFVPNSNPENEYYLQNNKFKNTMSEICNYHNLKPTYSFGIPSTEKVCLTYSSNGTISTDILSVYWKAAQVVERHVRRAIKIRNIRHIHNFNYSYVKDFKCNTLSYYIWVKHIEGIRKIRNIHSQYIAKCRYNFYSNDWDVKYTLNNLDHLEHILRYLSKDYTAFIYHNIIYRLFIIHSLHIYQTILNKVEAEYESKKSMYIEDYYNQFSFEDISDLSVYILEINENHGKLWDVTCD